MSNIYGYNDDSDNSNGGFGLGLEARRLWGSGTYDIAISVSDSSDELEMRLLLNEMIE